MGLCASSNAAPPGESGEAQDEFKSLSQDAVNRKRKESAQEKGLQAKEFRDRQS